MKGVLVCGVASSLFVALGIHAQSVAREEVSGLSELAARADARFSTAAQDLISRAQNQPDILLEIGRILGSAKSFPLAAKAFARAVELQPDNFDAQFNLGLSRIQGSDVAGSVTPLQKAVSLHAKSFDAGYLLAVAYSQTGRKTESIQVLRTARTMRPRHVGLLALLGLLYLDEGYPLDAADVLRECRDLDPGNLNVSLLMIRAYHDSFDFQKSLGIARETVVRFNDSADAWFRLAFELETAGQFAEAVTALETALQRKPQFEVAAVALARLDTRSGRLAEASSLLESVLRANPGSGPARLESARLSMRLKNFRKGRDLFETLAAEQPKNAEIQALLAQACQALGDAPCSDAARLRYFDLTRQSSGIAGMANTLAPGRPRRFQDNTTH